VKNAGTAISGVAKKHNEAVGQEPIVLVLGVLSFAFLTWCGARVAVPLPGTPIPGTLQTLSVLLAGLLLGPSAGVSSQALYVAVGLAGLPVFALPGAGPAYVLGPTGGYLAGFIAAPWIVGRLAGPGRAVSRLQAFGALLLGSAVVHACGFAWLLAQTGGNAGAALRMGTAPFALFDLAKVIAALVLHGAWARGTKWISDTWRSGSGL
jgi:biotin transport system substrate-specific component